MKKILILLLCFLSLSSCLQEDKEQYINTDNKIIPKVESIKNTDIETKEEIKYLKKITEEVVNKNNIKARIQTDEKTISLVINQDWIENEVISLEVLINKYWNIWDISFSPNWNQVLYRTSKGEDSYLNVYDILKKEIILSHLGSQYYWFTSDSKYFYIHSENEYYWTYYFKIYSMELWKEIKDIYDEVYNYYDKNEYIDKNVGWLNLKSEYFWSKNTLEINRAEETKSSNNVLIFDFDKLELHEK